jgi:outer membrane lipoprotein-sorting protein
MMFMKIKVNAVLALALCILLQAAAVFAADLKKEDVPETADLSALLNSIGKKVSNFNTLKTDFTEEKKMAMFKEKIILKGHIAIQKPNKIAWHVDSPLRYSVLITDKLIRQWDEDTDHVQEISLGKNPIFQNLLKQLTVWFSGEYVALLKDHTIRLVMRDPLTIEFTPLSTNMSGKVIRNITIIFREDHAYLRQIRIKELSGDVTTIYFTNTLLNVPLDKRIFEVRPVRERSSRVSPVGDVLRLSRKDAVALHDGAGVLVNGVQGYV